ncbi:MAG: MerR family DNA-binding protein [Methylococcaceae bacterium]|nr:MerR family DNA-binding protein [Methylococcaceae bacterium]
MALTIGKLAQLAGVNVETIRYYERIGLLNQPSRPYAGFRTYPAETARRIHFIKRAQQLGFSLKEISELLLLGGGQCEQVRTLAEQNRNRITSRIRDLTAMQAVLDELIECCLSERSVEHCSLIDSLSDKPRDAC